MRDFNFFASHIKKRKQNARRVLLYLVYTAVFSAAIAGLYMMQLKSLYEKNEQIAELNKQLIELKASHDKLLKQKQYIDELEKYKTHIAAVVDAIEPLRLFDSTTIEKIAASLPPTASLISIAYEDDVLTLTGTLPDALTAGSVVANLEKTGLFEKIEPSEVERGNDGTFTFVVDCTLKARG